MKPVAELFKGRAPVLYKVAPDLSVFDALKLLAEYGVGAVVVMDEERMVGVFSERDYTRKVALLGRNSRGQAIQVRRIDVSAITAGIGKTHIIGKNQNKIRLLRRSAFSGCSQAGATHSS